MGQARSRWPSKSLRLRFPLAGERAPVPRFDGWYGASDQIRLRCSAGGQAEFDGGLGTWQVDRGVLTVTTPDWQCEGTMDFATAYLLCSPEGRVAERVELELWFEPDPETVR